MSNITAQEKEVGMLSCPEIGCPEKYIKKEQQWTRKTKAS